MCVIRFGIHTWADYRKTTGDLLLSRMNIYADLNDLFCYNIAAWSSLLSKGFNDFFYFNIWSFVLKCCHMMICCLYRSVNLNCGCTWLFVNAHTWKNIE